MYLNIFFLQPLLRQVSLGRHPPLHGVAEDEHRDEDEDCDGGPDEDDHQGGYLLGVVGGVRIGDDRLSTDDRQGAGRQVLLLALPLLVGGVEDNVELLVRGQLGHGEVDLPVLLIPVLLLPSFVHLPGDVGDADLPAVEELHVDDLSEAPVVAGTADHADEVRGVVGQSAPLGSIRGSFQQK